MSELTKKKCVPCEGRTLPLSIVAIDEYQKKLNFPWDLVKESPSLEASEDRRKISRKFEFKDFEEAIDFVNQVASIAEDEGHHPDIHVVDYNKVIIELWTHSIGGLSVNDFIMASKIEKI